MTTTSTLRPGLLVSLKTSVVGNVKYRKHTLDASDAPAEEGSSVARWETERTIADVAEHEASQQTRSKAQALVRGKCTLSAFGLLCPEDKEGELDAAIEEANKLVAEFNKTAKLARIAIYVIKGRIAADDVQAVKAINSELNDLMIKMQEAMQNLDVKGIRDAANRARSVSNMVTGDVLARASIAIQTAREFATKIVKAGEIGSIEVDRIAVDKITSMRMAFLDLDDTTNNTVAAMAPEVGTFDLEPAKKPRNRAQDGYQPDSPAIDLE
jgi:hypothetical protein